MSFLASSIDYDYSKNCNRLRLTTTIILCLPPTLVLTKKRLCQRSLDHRHATDF